MEKEWLEKELGAGRSIESIAREVGKDPSTVAYWMAKYGFESQHAERHRGRGPLTREVLEDLVVEGASIREMAARLDRSYSTVRYWLDRHGLTTPAAARRARFSDVAERDVEGHCEVHGVSTFRRRAEGGYRCLTCRAEAVVRRRRLVKAVLVAEAGGACAVCGYDRCVAALQFHHLDPSSKAFHISHRGVTRSLERARDEAAKCMLLCANCHAEVEAGVATIPQSHHPPG